MTRSHNVNCQSLRARKKLDVTRCTNGMDVVPMRQHLPPPLGCTTSSKCARVSIRGLCRGCTVTCTSIQHTHVKQAVTVRVTSTPCTERHKARPRIQKDERSQETFRSHLFSISSETFNPDAAHKRKDLTCACRTMRCRDNGATAQRTKNVRVHVRPALCAIVAVHNNKTKSVPLHLKAASNRASDKPLCWSVLFICCDDL